MKKINYIISGIMGIALLAGCQEEPKLTINPAAQDGTLTFEINAPAHAGYTYVLTSDKADNTMETLYVRNQPDYGFTAATDYYAQVCFTDSFTNFVELEAVDNLQEYAINTKDMNKAITLLQGDNVNTDPGVMEVFIRLRATLGNAKQNVTDSVYTIKDAYSNILKLYIQPYYMLLKDADPAPYWLLGDINGWNNSANNCADGMIPMSLVEGYKYDGVTGLGEFTFTGYFEAGKGYKLVQVPGDWNIQVGYDGANLVFNDGGSGNITVAESGYYTLTANNATYTGTFAPADVNPAKAETMEFVGSFDEWGNNPIVMTPMGMPHLWYAEMTFAEDCEGKFRNDSSWGLNWGGDSFPYSTVKSGSNIKVLAGSYRVVFNDLDGNYYFFAQGE